MAHKPKEAAPEEIKKFPHRNSLLLEVRESDSEEVVARKLSALITSPETAASRAIKTSEKYLGKDIDVPTLAAELREQAAKVNRGDLSQAEAMLINQATALQTIFSRLVERAMGHENIAPFEANMRMALRAQSQCRATLETLAFIKNPPIVYARQANVTTGPQQVNNGVPTPLAREIESGQDQLLRENHELLSDAGTSRNAIQVNPALETLGEIHRPEDARR